MDRAAERLGTYAFLKTAEDTANSAYQRMTGAIERGQPARARSPATSGPKSWPSGGQDEEISGRQGTGRVPAVLERLLRYKPHTLGGEEKLLAMQSEMSEANQVFRQLTDADLKWA